MILEIISFMGKLSFLGDKYNSIDFGSEWWMFSYIQLVLLCDSEGPENKNYILGSLLISIDKFFSDSIMVNDFREGSSKIRDKSMWKVIRSFIVNINGIFGSDGVELCIISFNEGYGGLWFVNEAKSIKWVSKLVDVKEIFGSFL